MTPDNSLLNGAILRSTLLKALHPGALVNMKSASRLYWLKWQIALAKTLGYRGFSSGPPSEATIITGLTLPF